VVAGNPARVAEVALFRESSRYSLKVVIARLAEFLIVQPIPVARWHFATDSFSYGAVVE
jgi:hypothetical protein